MVNSSHFSQNNIELQNLTNQKEKIQSLIDNLDYHHMLEEAKKNGTIIVIDSCHIITDDIVIEPKDKNVPYFRKFEKRKRY